MREHVFYITGLGRVPVLWSTKDDKWPPGAVLSAQRENDKVCGLSKQGTTNNRFVSLCPSYLPSIKAPVISSLGLGSRLKVDVKVRFRYVNQDCRVFANQLCKALPLYL